MNAFLASVALALAASPSSSAFRQPGRARPSLALGGNLRDMASFPDDQSRMGVSDFRSFDRGGAYPRPPQGGMDPGMMYEQGGFDPYLSYGGGLGMSRNGPLRGTMGGFAYSSRSTDYGYGPAGYFDGPMMGGGFDGPMMDGGYDRGYDGPMMGGGMNYERGFGGGYPGFDGDMGRLGP